MKNKGFLGFNFHLEERIESLLSLLNESIQDEIKKDSEFKSIKGISFILGEGPALNLVINLRSGETVEEKYPIEVLDSEVSLSQEEIQAYFGEKKLNSIGKFLDGGTLDFSFLSAYEEELLLQLKKIYLLEKAPNVYNGGEFSTKDREFIIKLIKTY